MASRMACDPRISDALGREETIPKLLVEIGVVLKMPRLVMTASTLGHHKDELKPYVAWSAASDASEAGNVSM